MRPFTLPRPVHRSHRRRAHVTSLPQCCHRSTTKLTGEQSVLPEMPPPLKGPPALPAARCGVPPTICFTGQSYALDTNGSGQGVWDELGDNSHGAQSRGRSKTRWVSTTSWRVLPGIRQPDRDELERVFSPDATLRLLGGASRARRLSGGRASWLGSRPGGPARPHACTSPAISASHRPGGADGTADFLFLIKGGRVAPDLDGRSLPRPLRPLRGEMVIASARSPFSATGLKGFATQESETTPWRCPARGAYPPDSRSRPRDRPRSAAVPDALP